MVWSPGRAGGSEVGVDGVDDAAGVGVADGSGLAAFTPEPSPGPGSSARLAHWMTG